MPPPYDASVMTTNYAPSEEERVVIKEFIRSLQKELKDLQGTLIITHLQLKSVINLKEDTERKIQEIKQQIGAHEVLLSPARKIPDDIYREIFFWCLAPSSDIQDVDAFSATLLLTRVCGRWRQIVHSMPRLWTKLLIRYRDPEKMPLGISIVEQWMNRSGSLPISVICEPDQEAALRPAHLGLFATLAPSFGRWKDLAMTLLGKSSDIKVALRFLDTCGNTNPFLQIESLDLAVALHDASSLGAPVGTRREAYQSVMETLNLQRSTRLRRLHLHLDDNIFWRNALTGTLPETPFSSYLPCSQLEHLDMTDRHVEGERLGMSCHLPGAIAYQLLRDSPNLVTFKVDLEECHREDFPPDRFTLNKLQHMSLSFLDFNQTPDLNFLPYFDFPSLTSMALRGRDQLEDVVYHGATFDSLPLLFDALGRNLTKLTLVPGVISAQVLILSLSELSSLVQLHLIQAFFDSDFKKMEIAEEAKWDDAVLECLTPQADDTTPTHFCPNLQYLKWENNTWFTDRALSRFLLQRWKSPHSPVRLKQVHINFGRCMQDDISDECAGLVKEGLDLRLDYLDEPTRTNVGLWERSKEYEEFYLLARPVVDHDSDPLAFGWTNSGRACAVE
ncbi:hypothetical protein NMY22_g244 [Coprinellus aureogranulatus]|nr:hypothetical protein NMY22_g244 [Coprinellus aureogranulatus]